jgi:O-antigen biosynthesis protein WbqP
MSAVSAKLRSASAGIAPSPMERLLQRSFELLLALAVLPLLAVPMLAIAAVIRLTSPGSALYWSNRVGRYNRIFRMPKFRTMRMDTPQLPTHLLKDSQAYVTSVGRFLRGSSLDELPQLWSVLKRDLTLVGPRPALFNQDDLVELRTRAAVHTPVPGITGWAQINGRDDLPIPVKVEFDHEYLQRQSFGFDLKILSLTLVKVLRREGVSH